MRYSARLRPRCSDTAVRASSHSAVSVGSMSGSWWRNPSVDVIGPKATDGWETRELPAGRVVAMATVVYTDGACSGNPGPGGWAWAVDQDRFALGAEPHTTNQRMEITAAFEAAKALSGALEIVSDSTYVVNCFRDRWYEGWKRRDWRNSQRKPVANRDLWEPFVDLVVSRGDVTFRWVKGHSGDPMNDLVDRLAVEASLNQLR